LFQRAHCRRPTTVFERDLQSMEDCCNHWQKFVFRTESQPLSRVVLHLQYAAEDEIDFRAPPVLIGPMIHSRIQELVDQVPFRDRDLHAVATGQPCPDSGCGEPGNGLLNLLLKHFGTLVSIAIENVESFRSGGRVCFLAEETGLGVVTRVANLEDVGHIRLPVLHIPNCLLDRFNEFIRAHRRVFKRRPPPMVYGESCGDHSANVVDCEPPLKMSERIIDRAIVIGIPPADGGPDETISEADLIDRERRENSRTWHVSEKACPPYKERLTASNSNPAPSHSRVKPESKTMQDIQINA
jgi:hypothetical protein